MISAAALIAVLWLAPGAAEGKVKRARWVKGVDITEYYPAPEKWSRGKRVKTPGIHGKHRVDWLYSAWGMSMEGDGVGLDGRRYHISSIGSQGWVKKNGKRTDASAGFPQGSPYWRAMGWRNRHGRVTFPLHGGGWDNGRAKRYIKPRGIRFSRGPSRPLRYWRSIAVDPGTIPLGSKVFIPRYRFKRGGGCMKAVDTGSAINGKHVDVYRKAPAKPGGGGSYPNRRIYVVPKGKRAPKTAPRCLR